MIKNYLKIALRNLKRDSSYSLINILGLSLGIAAAVLIFGMVNYHMSFDTFHANADRIYRITTELHGDEIEYNSGVPSPLGEVFHNEYPFAEKVANVAVLLERVVTVSSGSSNEGKYEESIAFAEPDFFNIMDFPLVSGNPSTLLSAPNSVVVTQRIAKKYFGTLDPIGKTIKIDNILTMNITGVLKDLPGNTDRVQEIYIPFEALKTHSPGMVEKDWWFSVNRNLQCFMLVKPGTSSGEISAALAAIAKKHYRGKDASIWQFRPQGLSDIHFNTRMDGTVEKKNLWALSLVGVFLILTACVNFVNMATAQAMRRSIEIGIKKVLGVQRWQLFWQFMGETAMITLVAMIVALIFAELSLPLVNDFFEVKLSLNLLRDPQYCLFLGGLLIIMVIVSGSYPALVLAGLQPVLALKGKISQKGAGGMSLRRLLVIGQFGISQLLIIGALVVAGQMRYSNQADMGFRKDAMLMVPIPNNESIKLNTLKAKLGGVQGVESITFCREAPASEFSPNTTLRFASRPTEENFSIFSKAGDAAYVTAFALDLVAGRNLVPSDTVKEYLLNQTAVRKLGLAKNEEALGKTVVINGRTGTIVGIVKDFHNKSFHQVIDPVFITTNRDNYRNCAVKVSAADLKATLAGIQATWTEIYPNNVYKHDFLDERIAKFYKADVSMLHLIQVFAGIAILIGCLGLYGLVSFMAAQKTREVGLRKVLGATELSIIWLFGREFSYLLLIAFLIAAPLGWFVMNNWLQNFPYRISIGIGIFVSAILVNIIIASASVGYRAFRAARMNPIQSLRIG